MDKANIIILSLLLWFGIQFWANQILDGPNNRIRWSDLFRRRIRPKRKK